MVRAGGRFLRLFLLALMLPAGTAGAPAAAAAPPKRIVSLSPCTDAILLQVADPDRIAAISHYSQEAGASSVPLAKARRFRAVGDTAEEVIALRPDLVIMGRHIALATRNALIRAGANLLLLDVPNSIAESRAQITTIAQAVGAPVHGARLNARIDRALAAAKAPDGPPVPALIWLGDGLVPGKGTLADELLRWTGFADMSARYGLANWDMLPAESLIAEPPRVLFTPIAAPQSRDGSREAASRVLHAHLLDHLKGKVIVRPFPERLLHCAGPNLIEAATLLAAARRQVEARR